MALEPVFSRLALREKYALSVETIQASELPPQIRGYYNTTLRIERRILYENGEESRRQWLFKDAGGRTRLNAVLIPPAETAVEEDAPPEPAEAPPSADAPAEEQEDASREEQEDTPREPSGFIEIYNEDNLIVEEHRLSDDGSDEIINYTYNNKTLIKTETRLKIPPSGEDGEIIRDLWTDYYRYSRFSSLRGINRVYHDDIPVSWVRFPHIVLDAGDIEKFVSPNDAYSSAFLQDVFINRGDRVVYTTDGRGRLLTETRYDEGGAIIGEIRNTWSETNTILSVHWIAGEDDRLVEYEYDTEENRMGERNYTNGVLERVVQIEGDREVETLYMQGRPVLRAIWEKGRKISEERVRSQPGRAN
ncbi:MAG: hypothetical protein LBD65_04750 [Spirochaetaceae bacterium]|jgi:hypothetical protein|nr:hypothetical protein [Spirochaetaceae bacterium]